MDFGSLTLYAASCIRGSYSPPYFFLMHKHLHKGKAKHHKVNSQNALRTIYKNN